MISIALSFIFGILLGWVVATALRKTSSDGTLGFSNKNDKPTIVLTVKSPVGEIIKRGYAVFYVDERYKFEDGFEYSRGI